jgi:phage baseplate assembly protein W
MNKSYQHKRNSFGEIVSNISDIKQCVETIINTTKGEIPFCPELGTEIIKAIGENQDDAINIAIAIFSKELPKQEPRIEITDITGTKTDTGRIYIKIYYRAKGSNEIQKTEIYI